MTIMIFSPVANLMHHPLIKCFNLQKMLKKYISDVQRMHTNDSSVLQHTVGPVGQQSSIVYDAPG